MKPTLETINAKLDLILAKLDILKIKEVVVVPSRNKSGKGSTRK